MKKDDRVYLAQIIDAADRIHRFVEAMDEDAFMDDEKTQSAVIMQLALIGGTLETNFRDNQGVDPAPMASIAGFRDRAIHDYYQIDLQIAWGTILDDLDPLVAAINAYLGT